MRAEKTRKMEGFYKWLNDRDLRNAEKRRHCDYYLFAARLLSFRRANAIHSHGDYYLIATAWLCFGAAFGVKEICDETVIAEK